jgi:hypothetical protein
MMTEEINNIPENIEEPSIPTPSFAESISPEYKDLVEAKGFKSADDALKSYANLEKMVGSSIRLPNEDSSDEMKSEFYSKLAGIEGVTKLPTNDEERAQFYNKLGRPEESTGYNLGDLESAFDAESSAQFKELAHNIGLTNEQAAKLAEFEASFIPSEEQLQKEQEEYQANAKAQLEETWGRDYENRIKASLEVMNKYETKHPEAIAELKELAGNNPGLRVILADLAESLQEKGSLESNTRLGMTADGASDRISQLRADKGFMDVYLDSMHPGNKEAVKKMQELYQVASGR